MVYLAVVALSLALLAKLIAYSRAFLAVSAYIAFLSTTFPALPSSILGARFL